VPCRVVGRLSPTGTGMDTAVYANMETIRAMMKNAAELDFASFQGVDPEQAISAVLVKTAPDFSPEAVAQAISAAYSDLAARPAHGMVRSVEAGLGGVTGTVGVLLFVVWLLCIGLLALAFRLVFAERRGEFAVLLISGARRGVLARIVLAEALIVSSLGAAGGVLAGAFVLLPFAALLKDSFARPYLLPDASGIALLAAGAFCAAVLSAALAALWTVRRMDVTLREDM
ncbi:MAG: FtsX-like permease family protein, partial [Selenomonas sp.]